MNPIQYQSASATSDDLSKVAERAQAARWDVEWKTGPKGDRRLYIAMPNGRDKRPFAVSSELAERLLDIRFEGFRALGNYQAINDPQESYIEAYIRPAARFPGRYSFLDIPGVEIIRTQERLALEYDDDAADEISETAANIRVHFNARRGDRWRLLIGDSAKSWRVEFSESSAVGACLISDIARRYGSDMLSPTLKIFGISAATHDESLLLLEDIAGAVLFELELRYGVLYELSRYVPRGPLRSRRLQRVEQPPLLPRFRYPSEALSLYNYGRSASGMPLLQYLAFYQVLEFFFPQHFRRHQLLRLRQELTDPRFNVTDDGHLARVLSIASPGGRGIASERDQLKATISGCTDDRTLRDFINEDAARLEVLSDKKRVKNVPVIDMRGPSILDQAAERIYSLRCRIVHAKGDGGDVIADFLLPGSQEAVSLGVDVELVQFLAEKAIIASGSPLGR